MKKSKSTGGKTMTMQDRALIVETLGEMRQLKGEMKEFKEHVMGRVSRLEKKEGERGKERVSVFSLIIATAALAVSVIVNFFTHGGSR
jgi:hypothetical protein